MPPKTKKGATNADDDDWERLLEEERARNAADGGSASSPADGSTSKPLNAKEKKAAEAAAKASAAAAAAAAYLAQQQAAAATATSSPSAVGTSSGAIDSDDEEDIGQGSGPSSAANAAAKKLKKEKKKAAAEKAAAEKAAEKPKGPTNLVAKLAAEKIAAAKAEEERKQRELEAAQRALDEENARLDAEEKKKAELKAKRIADRAARKDAELKAGTYRTKKQKEDAARVLARLDAMKANGMVIEGFEAHRARAAKDLEDATREDDEEAAKEADQHRGSTPISPPTIPSSSAITTNSTSTTSGKYVTGAAMYGKKKSAAESRLEKEAADKAERERKAAAAASAVAQAAKPAVAALPVLATMDDWESAADAVETTPTASEISLSPLAISSGETSSAPTPTASSSTSSSSSSSLIPPTIPAPLLPTPPPSHPAQGMKSLEDRIEESHERRIARKEAAMATRSAERLRSPICVVLGHVDTGKTSLLDKIRRTNVQEGEAGGITQQIGATYFPMERLRTATDKLNRELHLDYKVPGLLIIDTPGHEQFTNLRSRGSSLCDIAVLVVDVMHGLERQTIESIELLRSRKTPFIVALNKVDRMYGWKANPNSPIRETLAKQPDYAVQEFETRCSGVLMQLQEQGLNAKLYYENDNFKKNVSVVPTSAFTGEGVPDLLMLLIQLTQQLMSHRLMFTPHTQATILEVKSIDGFGTTVDVVLVNGELKEGDTIVVCGMAGPIVTQIRALLTPPPLREMRIKSDYVHHKSIEAAMGVKIVAADLDKAVAGTEVLVVHPDDEIEDLKEEVMEDFENIMKGFKKDAVGVYVQASTLGSLEALLQYLHTHKPPVPVASVGIGPLHKKDVMIASTMLEHKQVYATILAFDVKITSDAADMAERLGVKIITADIIYHLTDQFDAFLKDDLEKKQAASLAEAVFPVIARIIPTNVFNAKDPIVCGVDVLEGTLKIGTPLCVVLPKDKVVKAGGIGDDKGNQGIAVMQSGINILSIGRVAGIQINHVEKTEAEAGGPSVALKIEPANDSQRAIMYGRHFDHNQLLYAHVSRGSIDKLKDNFRDKMSKDNWKTIIKLKGLLGVETFPGGS
jgi:translation initiation factor 5B